MLLRVICAVFCVALASAVECPNLRLVTAEMRQILMNSFSDVEYDCGLEARVQKDFERCKLTSDGISAELSLNGNDPQTLMKSMGSYAASMLSSGMTIGCGYDNSQCTRDYTIRCVMERPRKTSSSSDINCPNPVMTPEARKAVLDRHNEYRSMQALGTAVDFIPKVKNMYKMSYSCELEARAQRKASRCSVLYGEYIEGAENLFSGSASGKLPSVATTALEAADGWWAEIKLLSGMRIGPEELTFSDKAVGQYTAMARHDQMTVGCGYKSCGPGSIDFICRYQYGNKLGATLLQFGEPCKADADCTTLPNSTCIASKGLCSVNDEDRVPVKAGSKVDDGGNDGAGNNGTVEDHPSSAAASVIYGTVVLLVTILSW